MISALAAPQVPSLFKAGPEKAWNWRRLSACKVLPCLDWSSWQAGCEGFWMKVLSRSHTWRCPTGRFTCTSVLQPSLVTSHLPWLPSRVQGIAGFHGTRRGQWCIPGSCCITQCPVPSCRTIEPLLPEVFYAPRRNISWGKKKTKIKHKGALNRNSKHNTRSDSRTTPNFHSSSIGLQKRDF